MSTETYLIELYDGIDTPAGPEALSSDDVRELCSRYNQHTAELDAFLQHHAFERWRCVGVAVEEQGSDVVPDCSPAAFLGLLVGSAGDDAGERRLMEYLRRNGPLPRDDGGVTFHFDGSSNSKGERIGGAFNMLDDCPLWVLRIDGLSSGRVSGVVLLPEEFWTEEGHQPESAAYPYSVGDLWYHWNQGSHFAALRAGRPSGNTLSCFCYDIPLRLRQLQLDRSTSRLFAVSQHGGDVEYYDLGADGSPEPQVLDQKSVEGFAVQPEGYHVYTKKGLMLLDRDFAVLEKRTSKTGLFGNLVLQSCEERGWKVMITSKGLDLESPAAQAREKFSHYALRKDFCGPSRLLVRALDESTLVLLGRALTKIQADLSFEGGSLDELLAEKLGPRLQRFHPEHLPAGSLRRPDGGLWMFSDGLVLSIDAAGGLELFNSRLEERCGELLYHAAVADAERGGAWLLAGLGRIVFLPDDSTNAYVFNLAEQGCRGEGKYPNPWIDLDADGSLWFCLNTAEGLKTVAAGELAAGLERATPYGS